MNFFNIILVLVGVVALTDASISYEDQMRLLNDQMMLEEFSNIATDRDAYTVECSQDMLASLTEVMGVYNADIKKCEKNRKNAIKSLNAAAQKVINSFNVTLEQICAILKECDSIELPVDSLDCYEEKGSEKADQFNLISSDIATEKVKLLTEIEYAISAEDVCTTDAYAKYSVESVKINGIFTDCVNGKQTSQSPNGSTEKDEEKDENSGEAAGESSEAGSRRRSRRSIGQKFLWIQQ